LKAWLFDGWIGFFVASFFLSGRLGFFFSSWLAGFLISGLERPC